MGEGDCPVNSRVLSNIPGLYSLNASGTLPQHFHIVKSPLGAKLTQVETHWFNRGRELGNRKYTQISLVGDLIDASPFLITTGQLFSKKIFIYCSRSGKLFIIVIKMTQAVIIVLIIFKAFLFPDLQKRIKFLCASTFILCSNFYLPIWIQHQIARIMWGGSIASLFEAVSLAPIPCPQWTKIN